MTSQKQLAANRRNAQQSTGPRTAVGKMTTSMNAVKHGALSAQPVVPGLERPEEWEDHLAATLTSLQPEGHLETVLAERVALMLWRLNRLTRYEREVISVSRERVEDDVTRERSTRPKAETEGPPSPREVHESAASTQQQLERFERFRDLPNEAFLSPDDARMILSAVASQPETTLFAILKHVYPTFSAGKPKPPESIDWTAGLVRRTVASAALPEGLDGPQLLEGALERARAAVDRTKRAAERVDRDLEHMRRQRLVPESDTRDSIARHEAHLSRQLSQALHELERLQARRDGQTVPPPAALDVTVSTTD